MSRCEWLLPPGVQEETNWYDPPRTFVMQVTDILTDAGLLRARIQPVEEDGNGE